MKLTQARVLAERLVEGMRPYVERIAIAGSIRREKPEVRDIELVTIPRWEERTDPQSLFGDLIRVNTLYAEWAPQSGLTWLKGYKPAGQYWQAELPEGVKLDLFLATPESWGVDLLLRTGSAEFNQVLVRYASQIGYPFRGGRLCGRTGIPFDTPEEDDVFQLLRLEYIPPELRIGRSMVRVRKEPAA